MKPITDRTSYLRGLAEGLNIDKEKAENKLLLEMLAVMEDMAAKVQELDSDLDELDEYVASMESDLSDVEDLLFADGDEGDEDDEDDDMEELDEDEDVDVNCPHCGKDFVVKAGDINFDDDVLCPACGKNILDSDDKQE
ncbi:MAG: CD1247 N-terminal domain-containing protein [Bacillota bacterium]